MITLQNPALKLAHFCTPDTVTDKQETKKIKNCLKNTKLRWRYNLLTPDQQEKFYIRASEVLCYMGKPCLSGKGEVRSSCAQKTLCGDAMRRRVRNTATLAGFLVAELCGVENSCIAGREFFHKIRSIQKGNDLLGKVLQKGTCWHALTVPKNIANNLLSMGSQIKGERVHHENWNFLVRLSESPKPRS